MRKQFKIYFCVLLVMLTQVAPATVYYVTDNAGAGDTLANATSSSTPCTIQTAFAGLQTGLAAGDIVKVKAGNHALTGSITSGMVVVGTLTQPITFMGCDSSWNEYIPTRDATTKLLTMSSSPNISFGGYYLAGGSCHYVTLRGLNILTNRNGYPAYFGQHHVIINSKCVNQGSGTSVTGWTLYGNYAFAINCDFATTGTSANSALNFLGSAAKISNCVVYDSGGNGFSVNYAGHLIDHCLIYGYTTNGIYLAAGSAYNIYVTNSTIYGVSGRTGATYAAICFGDTAFITESIVANCILSDASGWGIYYSNATGSYAIFNHNRFINNASGDVSFSGAYLNLDPVTAAGTDFVDAANGNFNLRTTSPAITGGCFDGPIGAVIPFDWPELTSVWSGDESNKVQGTFPESTRNTDPGVAYVQSGHDYYHLGVQKTAALDLSTYTPISTVVAAGDVRDGVARYSGGSNGTCHVPTAAQTLFGVAVDVSDTGTIVLPSAAHVLYNDMFGPGAATQGLLRASFFTNCVPANIKNGVTIDDVTGTLGGFFGPRVRIGH